MEHFQNLYSAFEILEVEKCVRSIHRLVIEEMNQELTMPILDDEINQVVFSLGA